MLDFLLVLGQVPGTHIQITFNELVFSLTALISIRQYRKHKKAIRRAVKRSWYRSCVIYRRQKRQLKSFIKRKQYRVAVYKRRLIRRAAISILHKEYAVIIWGRRQKRRFKSYLKRQYRWALDQTYYRFLRFVRRQKQNLRRRQRLYSYGLYKRRSNIRRLYYIKVVQYERLERRAKKTKAFQSYSSIKGLVKQP